MHRQRSHRSFTALSGGVQVLTLAACVLVPLPTMEAVELEREDDTRRVIRATPSQREAVLYVMRENLRSVHSMVEAAHRGSIDEVRRQAQASVEPRMRLRAQDAFPVDTPKLWAELGRAADGQLAGVASAETSDRRSIWFDLGKTTRVCSDCHRRYRLETP